MARSTLTEIQKDIRAFLRDNDGDFWTATRLNPIIAKIRKEVSRYIKCKKRVYMTTYGNIREIDISNIADDIIHAEKVEFQVGNDPATYRHVKQVEANRLEIKTTLTPTRIAISSIADDGGGDITVTTGSAHGMSAGDYATITDTDDSNYDDTHVIKTVPTTTTLTVAATFGATATGYIGERVRLFYDGIHTLGATAANNTLPTHGEELLKQGVIAYANLEWVQEFRKYVDNAAALVGSGNEVNSNLDAMTARIEAAVSYLQSGDDLINTIPDWPTAVSDHQGYARTELAAARAYHSQVVGYQTEIKGNLDIARVADAWKDYSYNLIAQYEAKLKKNMEWGSFPQYSES